MKKQVIIFLVIIPVVILLSGCSMFMAMSGKDEPQMGLVQVGSTRGQVEMQLGSPIKSTTTADGIRIDEYEYEVGNEPSAGRAIGHGAMDVLTLGLWEIIGTPIEGFQGRKYRVTINYDSNDIVTGINSPASSKVAKQISNEAPETEAGSAKSQEQLLTNNKENSKQALPERWKSVGDSEGDFSVYIDSKSILSSSENTFRLWTKTITNENDFLDLIEVDCSQLKFRLVEERLDRNPALAPHSSDWVFIAPDSTPELIHGFVCKRNEEGVYTYTSQ